MKRILLTGASGFVGSALGKSLAARGDYVIAVSRGEALPFARETISWDELAALGEVHAAVHLAGENVAQRWTAPVKARILASRVESLARLRGLSATALISASAIGYYGAHGDDLLEEEAAPGTDFLAQTCVAWEQAAKDLAFPRLAILRFGLVLGQGGGALTKMLPPFRAGIGGRLGSGQQWVSWIHLDDVVGLLLRAIDDPQFQGVFNAVAPEPVRNLEFTAALAQALGTEPRLPVPAFGLKLMLGEMASMLLEGQKVSAGKAIRAGYQFQHPKVFEALRASL